MFLSSSSSSAESDTFLTIYLSSFSSLCCTHIRSRVSCFVYYIIYITSSLFSCFVISSYRNNLLEIVMASQQPRPAWFRFSSLAVRATAPPPPTAPTRPPPVQAPPAAIPTRPPTAPAQAPPPAIPTRPPAPMPALVRPSIPIRPSFPPPPAAAAAAAAAPPPPPPRPSPATPPAPPKSPIATIPAPAATPPRSPIATTPAPAATPPRSPIAAPPRSPIAAPTRSPAPPATRSPIVAPAPQPSPPRSPPKSPIPTPTRSPPRSSPVQRSTFTTNTPPKTKPQTPPSSSNPTNDFKTAKPIPSSPKEIRTPPPSQSPQIKPLSHPPSPFTLPPAQINADGGPLIEHKTVLEQHTTVVDKPMKSPRGHNNSAHSSSNGKRESMKSRTSTKKPSESEGLGMRVITLAGENKGAIMELSSHSSQKKKNPFVGNSRTLQNSSRSSSESDEDGSSSNKSNRGMRAPVTAAYLNSNVQGLNNSILYNTNFQHNDPGVHLSLTRNSNAAPLHRHG